MLQSAPIETHDLDTEKRHGPTLIIHMAKLVISMMFNTIAVMILIDSLGPDGSFVASYLSHDDFLLNHLGNVIVSLLTVTATGLCLLICSLVPEEPLSWRRREGLDKYNISYAADFLFLSLMERFQRKGRGCWYWKSQLNWIVPVTIGFNNVCADVIQTIE